MIFTFDKGIAPDLPERGHGFLVKARNCYSGVLGYEPVRSPSAITAALPAAWTGSGAFRDPTGVVTLLAASGGATLSGTGSISGTTLTLTAGGPFYVGNTITGTGVTGGTTITAITSPTVYTVSVSQTVASTTISAQAAGLYTLTATQASQVYSTSGSANWFLVQFGGLAIGFNGGGPVKYNLSTGVAALLGGSPPNASMGAIVRDFVFLAGDTTHQNRVTWSSVNNAEAWTAGINQSSTQDLPDEGAITGLSGGDFGLAFQDAAITIFEYIGSPAIFLRRKVSNSIGALCHGSIAQHGHRTFFYSRRGFYMWSPNEPEPVPIGRNKVDRTFRNSYSITDIRNLMRATIDPERSLVIWSMPDRLWVYNFENDMWSDILVPGIVGITASRTASITLDQIASTFPSIENVTPSLDDPYWNAGDPLLTYAFNDNKLYAFGGPTNLDASLRLPNLEINEGRVTHVRSSKVTGNMLAGQISIDCRARLGDTPVSVTSQDFRSNGELPIRCAGRYLQPEITIYGSNTWSSVQGVDLAVSSGELL